MKSQFDVVNDTKGAEIKRLAEISLQLNFQDETVETCYLNTLVLKCILYCKLVCSVYT